MKTFVATRNEDKNSISIKVISSDESTSDLIHRKHHSDDLEWGYLGSGPSDLARSIMWEVLGTQPHPTLYQDFKFKFIAMMPYEGFTLQESEIRAWLDERKQLGRDFYHEQHRRQQKGSETYYQILNRKI